MSIHAKNHSLPPPSPGPARSSNQHNITSRPAHYVTMPIQQTARTNILEYQNLQRLLRTWHRVFSPTKSSLKLSSARSWKQTASLSQSDSQKMAPRRAPPRAPKSDRDHFQNMMTKYKIRFLGPEDTIGAESMPANLHTTLKQVRSLGHTDYNTYTEDVRSDVAQQPWRHQRLERARTLFETVGRCLSLRKSEAGWRLSVEPLVCRRFTVEVAW